MISNDEARQNIAANVQRLMAIRGWDQSDLARESGENHMQISRVVRGTNLANAATLARVAEALDVTMDRLISEPPTEKSRRSA